ncbi:glycosyltransferase family 1 protein [Hypoxylon crocopeplum]|nr:glycosyltransferase family 1 protein [Hypoxylon crocopeplum]
MAPFMGIQDDGDLDVAAPPQYRPPDMDFPAALNIVIHVVGSRGDVQPFIALGNALQQCGHRVRLSTHDAFESFVRASGLEFFPVGGDPAELMAYMVNSPNLIPELATLREGAVQKKRRMYERILIGFWDSCIKPDPETYIPFVADAIIANPPSFAHIHCAEALGIPVHLMFTMPWSRTGAFPHPLSGIRSRGKNYGKINYASYTAVEFLTWQGLGDLVNHWKVHTLDLEAVPATEGPSLADTLKIPFTYCWSPSLVPSPFDWGSHIDVCGFFFREPVSYTAPDDLRTFLEAGPSPIYIVFGSIVVSDAKGMLAMILQAVKAARVRAIISQGWSNLVGEESSDIFYISDCPHEWLFQHVSAVVHHGGAGTTACGLRYGRPTVIVPFFGDQNFWGTVVNEAGAGPPPLPYEFLTSQKLASAIKYCLSQATIAAARLSHQMATEDGITAAVNSFHHHLPKEKMTCDFFPDQTAVWEYGRGKRRVKMCRAAATILRRNQKISGKELRLNRTGNVFIENHRWEPFTAVSSASLRTVMTVADAAAGIVLKPIEEYRKERPGSSAEVAEGRTPSNELTKPMRVAVPSGTAMLPLSEECTELISNAVDPEHTTHPRSHARAIAAASGNSIAKTVGRTTRGIVVDIPVAATEGMRAVPQLWGEQVRPHAVGCHLFYRVYEAMTGIFVNTFEEKKAQGSVGVARGLSKGTLGFATKTTAAVTGLVAYPAQGLSRSIRSAVKSNTRQSIMEARWKEGDWLIDNNEVWKGDQFAILQDFEGLKGRKGGHRGK